MSAKARRIVLAFRAWQDGGIILSGLSEKEQHQAEIDFEMMQIWYSQRRFMEGWIFAHEALIDAVFSEGDA